jgi:hypothetical protein
LRREVASQLEEIGALIDELKHGGHDMSAPLPEGLTARPAGARSAFERALGIFERFLPAGHWKIRMVQENLEAVREDKGAGGRGLGDRRQGAGEQGSRGASS